LPTGRPTLPPSRCSTSQAYPGVYLKLTNRTIAAASAGAIDTTHVRRAHRVAVRGGSDRLGLELSGRRRQLASLLDEARTALSDVSDADRNAIFAGTVSNLYPALGEGRSWLTTGTFAPPSATYPHTRALKTGALSNADVTFDFVEVEPIHKAFAPMVRRAAYDLCELANRDRLPGARPWQAHRAVASCRRRAHAARLPDCVEQQGHDRSTRSCRKRIGVRAYAQTTGMWVRAALREDHGLDVEDFQWVTHDPAHVEEYRDPAFVIHENTGKGLVDQLRGGDIDAAILGNDLPKDDTFAPVIRDHRAVDQAWVARTASCRSIMSSP